MTLSFKEAAQNVQKAKKHMQREIPRSLENSMEDVRRSMRHHLAANQSVATGTLMNGLTVVDDSPQVGGFAVAGIVGPDYWRYVEFGTGIFSGRSYKAADPAAPRSKIERWVRAKGITPRPGSPYDTQAELVGAIANSVSTGTEQHMFVRPAWRGLRGRRHVENEVGEAMGRSLSMAF